MKYFIYLAGDRIVTWTKPVQCPPWMNISGFQALPECITIRRLEYRVESPGCRSRRVIFTTTLLDARQYPPRDVAEPCGRRWQVETYYRCLKQTMHMDVLRCRSVEGVMRDLLMFAIIYNPARAEMVKAGARQGASPERISFMDTLRWLILRRPGEAPSELR